MWRCKEVYCVMLVITKLLCMIYSTDVFSLMDRVLPQIFQKSHHICIYDINHTIYIMQSMSILVYLNKLAAFRAFVESTEKRSSRLWAIIVSFREIHKQGTTSHVTLKVFLDRRNTRVWRWHIFLIRCTFVLSSTFLPRFIKGDLGISPRPPLIRSQRAGQVCVDNAGRKTKWEQKLRNYGVKLKLWSGGSQKGCCNWSVVATIRTTARISNEEIRKPSFFERVMIRGRSWHDPW